MDVKQIAMVMAGPHDPNGFYDNDPNRLSELRNHKWNKILTEQERGEFTSMAKAVVRDLTRVKFPPFVKRLRRKI